jgi:helix-turn-helix protein
VATRHRKPARLGEVIGQTLRRLRTARRQTQAEAAQHLQGHGLAWTRDHVAAIENGRRESIEPEAWTVLCTAYGIRIHELIPADDHTEIYLTPGVHITCKDYRAALKGGPLVPTFDGDRAQEFLDAFAGNPDETDRAVAERIGVSAEVVHGAAVDLWTRTLTAERDRRLGDVSALSARSRQAKRGAMTRALTQEIRNYIGKE